MLVKSPEDPATWFSPALTARRFLMGLMEPTYTMQGPDRSGRGGRVATLSASGIMYVTRGECQVGGGILYAAAGKPAFSVADARPNTYILQE